MRSFKHNLSDRSRDRKDATHSTGALTAMTKPVETTPKFWDVVFSLKTFAAAMLALWIGLMANLPNPYWSIAAVYIVAHPLSGATTSKGFTV